MGSMWNCCRCYGEIDSYTDARVSLDPASEGDAWMSLLCEECGIEIAQKFVITHWMPWQEIIRAHLKEIRTVMGLADDYEKIMMEEHNTELAQFTIYMEPYRQQQREGKLSHEQLTTIYNQEMKKY